jgi:peptide/nickel transport system substrate-binding protein
MTDPGNHTISRRTLLRGASILGMGAGLGMSGLLAACGVAADDDTDSGKKSGGTLTLAIDGTSAVNDPAFYTTLGDWMAVDCICRGLTFISFENNDVQPDLAESWPASAGSSTTPTRRCPRGPPGRCATWARTSPR